MDFPFENASVIDLDFGRLCSSFSGSGSTYRNGGGMVRGDVRRKRDLSGRKCRRDLGGSSTASAGLSVRGSYMQDSENGLVPGTGQKAERGKLLFGNHTSCRHLPVGHFDGKHFKSGSAADNSSDIVRKNGKRVLHIVL